MKIIATAFLFLLINSLSTFSQDTTKISKTWEVQKYDVTATLPAAETDRFLSAKAILTLKNVSNGSASSLTLRISPNATVSAVKINDSAADFTKSEEKLGSGALQKIGIRGLSAASGGSLKAEVSYKLKVDENSGLNALSPNGSQFLPLAYWYPTPNSWVFARGADYAPFRVQIITPNQSAGVSSGTGNSNTYEQKLNGQPFLTTGEWESVSISGVTFLLPKGADAVERQRAEDLANLAVEAKNFMSALLGSVPDAPLRFVPVRRGAGFADNGTIFIDYGVLKRQKTDSQTAMLIGQAVAKLWIGGAAGIRGEGEGAIRQGLPQFLATEFIEKKFGKDLADVERLRQRTAYAAISKRDAPLTMASPLDDFYYSENANKGAMLWRLLVKKAGQEEFYKNLRSALQDKNLEVSEMRSLFPAQKDFLDYAFDQVTEMNLLVGLPQVSGTETKVNLRNTGAIEATVSVTATAANGEKMVGQTTIPAKSFGEITFKTVNKIVRTEIDKEKYYPQTEYFDDVAPRQFDNSDAVLIVKQSFDQKDFALAEKNARLILQNIPEFDDVRVLLARTLLAEGKNAEAEREFQAALNSKLPSSRTLSWSNEGLGEIAVKNGQTGDAAKFFDQAVKSDGEYGATLAARVGRNKINALATVDESIKLFFSKFDAAVVSNRKADVDALVVNGEVRRFAGGISGQTESWQTKIVSSDKLDTDNYLVETFLNTKLLNREPENGTAVFRLSKINGNWKISGIEIFEVK